MDDYSYKWSHFRDLPTDPGGLADTELGTLRKVWLEQRGGLEEQGLVSDFTQRLIREYAIEGGIIERAYTLDRGITQLLIDRGIDASRPMGDAGKATAATHRRVCSLARHNTAYMPATTVSHGAWLAGELFAAA